MRLYLKISAKLIIYNGFFKNKDFLSQLYPRSTAISNFFNLIFASPIGLCTATKLTIIYKRNKDDINTIVATSLESIIPSIVKLKNIIKRNAKVKYLIKYRGCLNIFFSFSTQKTITVKNKLIPIAPGVLSESKLYKSIISLIKHLAIKDNHNIF